ncbi:MAG TPA: hypothetical protein VES95_10445 [Dermatophilaceae bacterium]|nr:hypothetical protein [Dermatophilaceae bacterium]
MRWEGLFADLEGQSDAEERRELDAEVADRTRRELATVALLDRLLAHRGTRLEVRLVDGRAVAAELVDVGADWLLLRPRSPRTTELLVPAAALAGVTGLAVRTGQDRMARRFSLGHALRALARDRARVTLVDLAGTTLTGTINLVGADHLDLAEHPLDEPRRAGNVIAVRTVPFSAVVWVESA